MSCKSWVPGSSNSSTIGRKYHHLGVYISPSKSKEVELRISMKVSWNRGTPKSILMGLSIINHPFRGTPIDGNPHILQLSAKVNLGLPLLRCEKRLGKRTSLWSVLHFSKFEERVLVLQGTTKRIIQQFATFLEQLRPMLQCCSCKCWFGALLDTCVI